MKVDNPHGFCDICLEGSAMRGVCTEEEVGWTVVGGVDGVEDDFQNGEREEYWQRGLGGWQKGRA